MTNPYAPDNNDLDDDPFHEHAAPYSDLDVGELEARVIGNETATATAIESLGNELVAIKELVAKLLEQEKAKTPQRWAAYATDDEWTALTTWVNNLNTDYSLNRQYAIPSCWAQHPGVVEDLAALWSSWKKSAIEAQTSRRGGTNDYIAWHDRWLWPTLKRLREGHYDIANCRQGHARPVSSPQPSQRP